MPFFHKKVSFLANFERCPELLEYALMVLETLMKLCVTWQDFLGKNVLLPK